jgi:uncharacterized protein YrrD
MVEMRIPEPADERPLSWLAMLENTPVYSSDGEDVGGVKEVIGSEVEDIFHGIAIGHGLMAKDIMIPAANVVSITNKRVDVNLTAEEVRALSPYVEEDSYHLGFVGMFSKRLGWTEEGKRRH